MPDLSACISDIIKRISLGLRSQYVASCSTEIKTGRFEGKICKPEQKLRHVIGQTAIT
jgi:hypothetical protein